jgi:hypothetical protein
MRRLLSPIGHRHLPSAGAHACRHTCSPAAFFGFSLLCPIRGAGALPQFRPSPSFSLFGGEIR